MKKLINITPDWSTNGIFHFLNALDVPWKTDNIDGDLDIDYYGNNSGDKFISPLVEKLLGENEELTTANMQTLANIIFTKYGLKWTKLWATLSFEYNPIENYRMEEKHEGTDTHTFTPDDYKETVTQKPTNWKVTQRPNDWKVTQTPTDWITTVEGEDTDNESNSSTKYYGFGSDSANPLQDVQTKVKNKQTTEISGTYENETSGTFEEETSGTFATETTKEGTEEDKTEYDTTLTRSGNIGVTTSQQMIESERKLWEYNIFKQIYEDVDDILTINIY